MNYNQEMGKFEMWGMKIKKMRVKKGLMGGQDFNFLG